jgi:hypothetical protein
MGNEQIQGQVLNFVTNSRPAPYVWTRKGLN